MLRSPNQFTWSEYSDFIKAVDALENQKDNENELQNADDQQNTMTEAEMLEDDEFWEIHE